MPDLLLSDGTKITFSFSGARRGESSADEWDTGQWDIMQWDGGSVPVVYQIPGARIQAVSMRKGKDSFGKRFRTSTMSVDADNSDGLFTTKDGVWWPGDYMRWFATAIEGSFTPFPPTPIPDATMWNDSTGREWTAHGSLVLEDDRTAPETVQGFMWYGKVNSGQDVVRGGVDVTRIKGTDSLAEFAAQDRDALGVPVGAGEGTSARMDRIFNQFGYTQLNLTQYGEATPQYTMQETTLAQPMLDLLQITMDSEGGDLFAGGEPGASGDSIMYEAFRDWLTVNTRSTVVQWAFGGMGLPILDARPTRELQLVVNSAAYANTGSTEQTSTDVVSYLRYGERTTRRLDLVGDTDSQAQFLADRRVATSKEVRSRVSEVSMHVNDFATAKAALDAQFGDLTVTNVASIHGWSDTFAAHIIGITHEWTDTNWTVTYKLDDTAIPDNVNGPFDVAEFDDSFALGGH